MHLKLLKKAQIEIAPKLIKENDLFLLLITPCKPGNISSYAKSGKQYTVLTRAVWNSHDIRFLLPGQDGEFSGAASESLFSKGL